MISGLWNPAGWPLWEFPFWSWPGWTAIASLGTAATLGTLIFFWLQLREASQTRRDERAASLAAFRAEHTPFISVRIARQDVDSPNSEIVANFEVNADGAGVAYNLILNVIFGPGTQPIESYTQVVDYLRAPATRDLDFKWPIKPGTRQAWAEWIFTNQFGERQRWRATGKVEPAGMRLDYAPAQIE